VTTPSENVRRELERYLNQDPSRVGQVYRLDHRGLSPDQIATELGVSTSGFVSNARSMARGLLEGHVPSGPAAAQQVLSFVRKASKSSALSSDARSYLQAQVDALQRFVERGARPTSGGAGSQAPSRSQGSTASTLRDQVDRELSGRASELAQRIRAETRIDPVDYWAVTTSASALDVVVRLVQAPGEQGTFKKLVDAGRIDLTLETAVLAWAKDLPVQRDLVEEADAKRDWFS
jgi:hypothetical protein